MLKKVDYFDILDSKSHDRVYEDYDEKELFKFLLNQLKENTNDYDIAHKVNFVIIIVFIRNQ